MTAVNYKPTLRACYLGYVTQAVVNNLAPLLFALFQTDFSIPLEKIGQLILLNFGTQLLVDLASVKLVDRLGYRFSACAAHLTSAVGLALLGLLFVPECDDCYFVYWSFDSLRDWLLTRPSTAGAEIVGVPENGRYLGNLLGVLQGKLYFVYVVGPILRGLLMGGALWALVCLLARRARRGPVGRGW